MIKGFIAFVSFLVFLAWAGARIYAGIQFDQHIENYISQAASSPSPQIAEQKLGVAIAEIDREGLTSCNTGILFTYPTNDLGFWYGRLVDSRALLRRLPPGDSELEVSNTMMRVHESLVSDGKNGQSIVVPEGISIYPHNVLFLWWGLLSGLTCCVFGLWALLEIET